MQVDKPDVIRSGPQIHFNEITNEGVPAYFKSSRENTVKKFYDMIFPEQVFFDQ